MHWPDIWLVGNLLERDYPESSALPSLEVPYFHGTNLLVSSAVRLCHPQGTKIFLAEAQGPQRLKSTEVMPSPRTLRLCGRCSTFNQK